MSENDAEILRLRQRCHDLEGNVKIMHQLVSNIERRLGRNERDVRGMKDEVKIAKEVNRRVREIRKVTLTRLQQVAFFTTVICSVGGLALGIIAATGGHP